jgi:hypothetical protein
MGLVSANSGERALRACWLESLAVAQFTRRGGRPLQRRLAENELKFTEASEGNKRFCPRKKSQSF